MINLDYKSGKSIHEQIQDGIKNLIMNGSLKIDEQLPSVRELSVMLTINPNTVQKAYKELETDGFIYSVRGKGNFVSRIEKVDDATIKKLLEIIETTARELNYLSVDKKRIMEIIDIVHGKED